ncbi:DinB family protein [Streptomyces oceani]|uniref:Mini-circle protein n=1 Tax=Streptomyces oceani TaxID=1075402 RepID=A0A1E7KJR0_9ACTN|nr:DinB family protein [Streptomyces oceani]OEV04199.1 Mini-circle protein [Streptomyces oceani]
MSTQPRDLPSYDLADPKDLLAAQLDYYRATLRAKTEGPPESELRRSRLPSRWSPLELVWHLTHVERRWLEWGFEARPLTDPWADHGPDGRWQVPAALSVQEVLDRFEARCARSRTIVNGAELLDRAACGGRFPPDQQPPTLGWILCHLLQEYARHVGQLDVVRELADGATGE